MAQWRGQVVFFVLRLKIFIIIILERFRNVFLILILRQQKPGRDFLQALLGTGTAGALRGGFFHIQFEL